MFDCQNSQPVPIAQVGDNNSAIGDAFSEGKPRTDMWSIKPVSLEPFPSDFMSQLLNPWIDTMTLCCGGTCCFCEKFPKTIGFHVNTPFLSRVSPWLISPEMIWATRMSMWNAAFAASFSLEGIPPLCSQIDQTDWFDWFAGVKKVVLLRSIRCYVETWCSLPSSKQIWVPAFAHMLKSNLWLFWKDPPAIDW